MTHTWRTLCAFALVCLASRGATAQTTEPSAAPRREGLGAHLGVSALLIFPGVATGLSAPLTGPLVGEFQAEVYPVLPGDSAGTHAALHGKVRWPRKIGERWHTHWSAGFARIWHYNSVDERREPRLDGSVLARPAHEGWRHRFTWIEVGIGGIRARNSGARLRWDFELGVGLGLAPRFTITTMWGGPS